MIAELVRLSARLKARVSLSHVSRPVLILDCAEELRTSSFTDRIMHLYPGIGCSNLRADNIIGALEQLSTEKHADVIGLRYRKHPVWYRLFNENSLKEAIQHSQTPLLIFPAPPGSMTNLAQRALMGSGLIIGYGSSALECGHKT